MERRNFFKLVGTASGGVLTGACGKTGNELIPILVTEQEIVPGVEEWHPSVCRECSAGCGIIVRVMEAQRKVEREGETVLEPVAAIKKIEGNPLDPVSGGRMCARGQAAVQRLYHPDRLRGPQRRTGGEGARSSTPVDWDEALEAVAGLLRAADPSRIVYLSRPEGGTRAATIARFLEAIGAPPASTTGISDFTIERRAAEAVYGWAAAPLYQIQDATYVLSIGADFLGGWMSPVLYARRFGHFRQGRPQIRGTLVHAESRFSQTAWAADRWLPVQPGGEQVLALAIGRLLIESHGKGGDAPDEFRSAYLRTDLERASELAGIPRPRIEQVAAELAAAQAPLVVGGASIVQTNSLAAVTAANGLNLLLRNVGKPGGVSPSGTQWNGAVFADPGERLANAEIVFVDGVDPAYTSPALAERLRGAKAVISFASFLDDTAALADWILPDNDALENALAVTPAVAPVPALTGAPSFVKPLYDTRSVESVLASLAKLLEKPIVEETPARAYRTLFDSIENKDEWDSAAGFAEYAERQGGWWAESGAPSVSSADSPASAQPFDLEEARFAGNLSEYPLVFQPYLSIQFGDGTGANLPWLQELPDPASSAMWGLPLEIDPATAGKVGVRNGDLLRATTPSGSLEAPAYIHPAAIPGVVSMAVGQGHNDYGRYATGRGANPLSIAGSEAETRTGVPAFGASRCRLEKAAGRGRLVQFSSVDRERNLIRL